jgi:hypothetical protein
VDRLVTLAARLTAGASWLVILVLVCLLFVPCAIVEALIGPFEDEV